MGCYGMLVELLKVSTKGVNPMKLECFDSQDTCPVPKNFGSTRADTNLEHTTTSLGKVDFASSLGAIRLKSWAREHQASLRATMEYFELNLYEVDLVRPIGALCKLFEW